jgi:putative ABC transport system ATP-binding protein
VRLQAVSKVYGKGAGAVQALRGVSIALPYGSFTAVMGPSGSGKSTLLQLAAGLDRPSRGRAWIGAVDLSKLSQTRLTELRRDRVGFVFQAFNLVPSLTVEQNITLPSRRSCSPMSRPVRWTCAAAGRCSGCFASWSTHWDRRW